MKFHELANIFPLMEVKRLMACAQNIKANGLRDQIVTLGDKILDGRFVWVKDRTGTGYWNMNQHELLLVGTRGNVPAPAPGAQWSSVIAAPRGAHSEKPERAYELIRLFRTCRRSK